METIQTQFSEVTAEDTLGGFQIELDFDFFLSQFLNEALHIIGFYFDKHF